MSLDLLLRELEKVDDKWKETAKKDPKIQEWYKELRKQHPDEPEDIVEHMVRGMKDPRGYNSKKAIEAGARPGIDPKTGELHWPSEFKNDKHPTRYVDGVDTRTGKPVQRDWKDYEEKAQSYLDKRVTNNDALTGKKMADAARKVHEDIGIYISPQFALAQFQQEGSLDGKGRSPFTNPGNVGEWDDKTVSTYKTMEGGLEAYYRTIGGYLDGTTEDALLKNFVNKDDKRYAQDKNYEKKLSMIKGDIESFWEENLPDQAVEDLSGAESNINKLANVFASQIARALRLPIQPPGLSDKQARVIWDAAHEPERVIHEGIGKGYDMLPKAVRENLFPKLTPPEFINRQVREAENEFQKAYLQEVGSLPASPEFIGIVAPMVYSNFVLSGQNRTIAKIEKALPLFDKSGIKWRPGMSGRDKAVSILVEAQKNAELGDIVNRIIRTPSFVYGGGPSTQQLVDFGKRFGLSPKQIKMMSKGVYLGIPNSVISKFEELQAQPDLSARKVKPAIRKATGQVKVGNLVKEDKALREVMKAKQRESRAAFSAGKKEEGLKLRKEIKALAERSRARRVQRIATKRMLDDISNIDTSKMSPQEAKPINEILKGVELVRHSKPWRISLQKTKDYIKNNPDAELPEYVWEKLEHLEHRDLNNISVDELKSIHSAVMTHVTADKTKRVIKVGRELQRKEQVLADSVKEMKSPKKVKSNIVASQDPKIAKLKKSKDWIVDTFGIRHDHYDLIVESLAGPNSVMDKVLYQEIKAGVNRELAYKQGAFKGFQDDIGMKRFIKKFRIKDIGAWQNERVKVGKFNFTRGERMALYRHSLNEDNLQSVLEAGFGFRLSDTPNKIHKITETELNAILNDLSLAEREFSGQPVTNLFDRQQQAIDKVHYIKNGYPLPNEANYYPKDTMPIGRGAGVEAETAIEGIKGKWTRVGTPKGHLKKRLRVKTPLYLNSLAYDLNKSVNNSAAYIGLELPVSNASKLLYDPKFRIELEQRYGKQTWTEIEKGIRDIVGDWESYSTVEAMAMRLKNNMSSGILGLNPFVMLKQILSFPLYNTYVKAEYLIQGMIDADLHPLRTKARLRKYSPELIERLEAGYSRDVSDVFKKGSEKRTWGGKKKILSKENLMSGVQMFDRGAVIPGMQGAVLQCLAEFETGKLSSEVRQALDITPQEVVRLSAEEKMQQAHKFADWVTERTQPMFSPEHRSSLSRGPAMEQLITQFSAFTNQALNLLRRTWRDALRTKDPKKYAKFLKVMFYLAVVNTAGVMAIDNLRDRLFGRDRQKTYWEALADSLFSYIYFLRDLQYMIKKGVKKGTSYGVGFSIPILNVINLTGVAAIEGINAMTEKSRRKRMKNLTRMIDSFTEALLLGAGGIPYRTPKELIKMVGKMNISIPIPSMGKKEEPKKEIDEEKLKKLMETLR